MIWATVKFYLLVALAGLLLGGCSFAPTDKVINALAKDPASAYMRVNGPAPYGGSIILCRTGQPNAKIACRDDGMSVESTQGPAIVPVPVTIVPRPNVP